MKKRHIALGLLGLLGLCASSAALAQDETVTYQYDVLGRVTEASYAGGTNNGMHIVYSYDAAGNRTAVNVTGAPNLPRRVIVVPMGGLFVIPIP
jgi:hypothetical protein